MPKKVRLNDKIWFGKYRGRTIRDILDYDSHFLDILLDNGKITYHENVLDFLIKQKPKFIQGPTTEENQVI